MAEIDPAATLGALVAESPARAELFERLRLDYCCGGSQTLAEAAERRGLDPGTVAEMIAALDGHKLPADDRPVFDAVRWRRDRERSRAQLLGKAAQPFNGADSKPGCGANDDAKVDQGNDCGRELGATAEQIR